MKALIFALALALPMVGHAEEGNALAGRYSGCVDETAHIGRPSSKWYAFTLRIDSSIEILTTTYLETVNCDNRPSGAYEYKPLQVIDDTGDNSVRVITAKNLGTKLYLKFVIEKSHTAIYVSEAYPVKDNFIEMMLLYREP